MDKLLSSRQDVFHLLHFIRRMAAHRLNKVVIYSEKLRPVFHFQSLQNTFISLEFLYYFENLITGSNLSRDLAIMMRDNFRYEGVFVMIER